MKPTMHAPDVRLAQIVANARERVSAPLLSPEKVSMCNAFVALVREDILKQLSENAVGRLRCMRARTWSGERAMFGISAMSTPKSLSSPRVSEKCTVEEFLSSSDDGTRFEIGRGFSALEEELSNYFGFPESALIIRWHANGNRTYFGCALLLEPAPNELEVDFLSQY